MKWPPDKPVDWADAIERKAWASELRDHIFDLFVIALQQAQRPRKYALTLPQARESLLANKQVIDEMLELAGVPIETSQKTRLPLPSPRSKAPPESAERTISPFEDLSVAGWSEDQRTKWLGYVEGQLDYIADLMRAAYPEGSEGHLRAFWAVIRLRALFGKLRVALLITPMHR